MDVGKRQHPSTRAHLRESAGPACPAICGSAVENDISRGQKIKKIARKTLND